MPLLLGQLGEKPAKIQPAIFSLARIYFGQQRINTQVTCNNARPKSGLNSFLSLRKRLLLPVVCLPYRMLLNLSYYWFVRAVILTHSYTPLCCSEICLAAQSEKPHGEKQHFPPQYLLKVQGGCRILESILCNWKIRACNVKPEQCKYSYALLSIQFTLFSLNPYLLWVLIISFQQRSKI